MNESDRRFVRKTGMIVAALGVFLLAVNHACVVWWHRVYMGAAVFGTTFVVIGAATVTFPATFYSPRDEGESNWDVIRRTPMHRNIVQVVLVLIGFAAGLGLLFGVYLR